ncbi:MAG TPA: FAD-dependent oxidoreductase [Bryobacteraceae bacterium]|nr:FAD-dependent oxidoreductase [Bryobacteraceae bacterium]
MPDKDHYEILIIGSGEAGKSLAWAMAKDGRTTAVVERRLIGGSCPNIACLPSKNVIHSAKVADLVHRAREFGLTLGSVKLDMAGVRSRKRQMVDGLVRIHLDKYQASGAELIMGEAHFVGEKAVEVRAEDGSSRILTGDQVFLNVGTHAALPDIPGLEAAKPLTHVEALELDRLPKHLFILGGGFVGLEFAQAMRRFGSSVTILERGPQVARGEDADVSDEILRIFRDDGIEVLLNTDLAEVRGLSGQQVQMRLIDAQGERIVQGSDLLVAAGRVPNTQTLGLQHTGVELDDRGYIRVNERLQTTAPDIWAMGECAGSPQFTHVAFDDFRVVRDNLTGGNRTTMGRMVPFCLFTDPEFARIGLNETEARRQGIGYRLAKIAMAAVLRTRTLSETRGFLKALIGESDEILGFSALGEQAGELMSVVQTAMMGKLPYTSLRDAIFTHPTMAEGLNVLFAAAPLR